VSFEKEWRMFALIALTLGAAAPAASPRTHAPQKLTTENMVCRHMEEPGSRVGGRLICKTQAEWTNEQDEAQHLLQMRQARDFEYGKGAIVPH
jgi:hypothetical protein